MYVSCNLESSVIIVWSQLALQMNQKMKRMELFCSSPSSTAICSSLDHKSMIRRSTHRLINSCSSQSPNIHPNPYYFHQKNRKSSSFNSGRKSYNKHPQNDQSRRKSCADATDFDAKPTGSLLSDKIPYIDWIDQSSALIIDSSYHHAKPAHIPPRSFSSISESAIVHTQTSPALKSSSSARSRDQVVVLWVSIHCKGCEGKVRKHISKMEGVRSFSIDLATKKVTVVGNVTPLAVLASLSKVKNAQLWPSPSPTWST